jgi:hypothetical protein
MNEEEPTLENAERLSSRIKTSLVPHVSATEIGALSTLPWKLVSSRELLLHRIASLSESAVALYKAQEPVAAVLVTRAILETAATMHSVLATLKRGVDQGSAAGVDEELMNVLFGSRNGMTVEVARNILGRIEKVDARYKGYRWWYDELSEVAHPNYMGLFDAFGDLDKNSATLKLGPNPSMNDYGEKIGLPALCSALEIAIFAYDEMPQYFDGFVKICEANVDGGAA